MTNPTPRRFRPRFSIRTLVILVTLACVVLSLWHATRTAGITDVDVLLYGSELSAELGTYGRDLPGCPRATIPLVVAVDAQGRTRQTTHYYFWMFGHVSKLPYERHINLREKLQEYLKRQADNG